MDALVRVCLQSSCSFSPLSCMSTACSNTMCDHRTPGLAMVVHKAIHRGVVETNRTGARVTVQAIDATTGETKIISILIAN